ncbi:unnamed protein product, partial [Prorocentrum cordatum]
ALWHRWRGWCCWRDGRGRSWRRACRCERFWRRWRRHLGPRCGRSPGGRRGRGCSPSRPRGRPGHCRRPRAFRR